MTPSVLIRQLEEWSRHPVRGKEISCRYFLGKMLSFTNDNFEMPIPRKSRIEYLPFELQNPFSTLLCFAFCLRRLIYVYFISGTPSPCSFWLCSANGELIEEGEGRKEKEIMVYFPGFPTVRFLSSSLCYPTKCFYCSPAGLIYVIVFFQFLVSAPFPHHFKVMGRNRSAATDAITALSTLGLILCPHLCEQSLCQ